MNVTPFTPSGRCRFTDCPRPTAQAGLCRRHYSEAKNRKARRVPVGAPMPPAGKLTAADIAEARRLRSRFKSPADIAAIFGVSVRTLNRALDRPAAALPV